MFPGYITVHLLQFQCIGLGFFSNNNVYATLVCVQYVCAVQWHTNKLIFTALVIMCLWNLLKFYTPKEDNVTDVGGSHTHAIQVLYECNQSYASITKWILYCMFSLLWKCLYMKCYKLWERVVQIWSRLTLVWGGLWFEKFVNNEINRGSALFSTIAGYSLTHYPP